MSDFIWSRLLLFSQADALTLVAAAVTALGVTAAAVSYLGHYAAPERVRIRTWVPIPADLPERPAHLRVMYGASDLKARYRKFMMEGISGAALTHAAIIGLLALSAAFGPKVVPLPKGPICPGPDDRIIDVPDFVNVKPLVEGPRGTSWADNTLPPPPPPNLGAIEAVPDERAPLLRPIDSTDLDVPPGPWGDNIWGGPKGQGDGEFDPFQRKVVTPPAWGAQDDDGAYVGPVEVFPELVSMRRPVYPDMARSIGLTGDVRLRVLVNTDGRVLKALVVRSAPAFDQSALDAIRTAQFKPARWNGKPVRVWVEIPIQFRLD